MSHEDKDPIGDGGFPHMEHGNCQYCSNHGIEKQAMFAIRKKYEKCIDWYGELCWGCFVLFLVEDALKKDDWKHYKAIYIKKI